MNIIPARTANSIKNIWLKINLDSFLSSLTFSVSLFFLLYLTCNSFEIRVKNVTTTGDYLLNTNTTHPGLDASYAFYVRRRFNPTDEWITSAQYTGKVTITKIETGTNAIASGLFEFDAIGIINSGHVIHITEGRFDVKLP